MIDKLVTVQTPDPAVMVAESAPLIERANSLVVESMESHGQALEGYKVLKLTVKKVKQHYEPTRSALDTAKKELLRARDSLIEPIETAMKIVSSKAAVYEKEEQRKAQEAARVAEETERKRLEEETLRRAEEAEAAGNDALAESIINKPVNVVVEKVETETATVKGVSARKKYHAEVFDLAALLRYANETGDIDLVEANLVTLNARARAQKELMQIPGVRVITETVRSVRG